MSGWVSVTGPPARICCSKSGTTLPWEPSTFPKRTAVNSVSVWALRASMIISARRLVAPMTLVGLTALSVEMSTKRFTPWRTAACAVSHVPNTLFFTAWSGQSSMRGTCL